MNKPIIQVNRIKALKQNAIPLMVLLIIIGFISYLKTLENPSCSDILGINFSYITIIYVTYGLPILGLIVSLSIVKNSYKEIKYGYSPPLDTYVFFRKKKVCTGLKAKLMGYLGISTIALSVLALYIGNYVYTDTFKSIGYSEFVEIIEKESKCNA